jgi:hypothetical protein
MTVAETKPIRAGFEFDGVMISIDKLLATRRVPESLKHSTMYKSIVASIREVGVIEPLSVYPQKGGKYLLLDGHARVEALRELGVTEALCLISKDDEGYTHNHQVNRVSAIQANKMIVKALNAGVPEERIAKALNRSVHTVRHHRSVLQHLCPEAVEVLKDKMVALGTLALFKKVKPIRQIAMADMMVAAGNYTGTYARGLIMTTVRSQLVDPESPKKIPGVKPEDLARMEHEIRILEKDFLAVEESYSRNNYELMMARGYLKKLLDNGRVVRFLAQKQGELLVEFQRIVEAAALEG